VVEQRVLIHPNGQIQICALMIGTPYSIAKYEEKDDEIKIIWEVENNELKYNSFYLDKATPCSNQRRYFKDFCPLCISFKPEQEEFIWERLKQKWELRFKQ
jgi:hypothetical protein